MTLVEFPWWGLPIGDAIASRRFEIVGTNGGHHVLEARLGRPIELATMGGYCCPFQVDGFGTGNPKWSRGEDALTALQNALAALDAEVCIIECNLGLHQANGTTTGVGFREVPLLRELWRAWCLDADYGKAVDLSIRLAEAGIAFGQKVLGLAKWLGLGTQVDIPEAIPWLQKAAEQGEADACDALANLYTSGHFGTPQDRELGEKYRKMARYYGIEM